MSPFVINFMTSLCWSKNIYHAVIKHDSLNNKNYRQIKKEKF